MLDEICDFAQEYHLVRYSIGFLVFATLFVMICRRIYGKWKWEK